MDQAAFQKLGGEDPVDASVLKEPFTHITRITARVNG